MTLILTLMMEALVSTEFVPQASDRNSSLVAKYIFEPPIICGSHRTLHDPRLIRFPILVPPYQNVVSDPFMENPHSDRQEYRPRKPEIQSQKIDIGVHFTGFNERACHSRYGVRIPPKFPAAFLTGNSSGLCKVSFSFDETGKIGNMNILSCTHDSLQAPTREAVNKWQQPADACNISKNQTQTIRFELVDENGVVLPYP